MIQLSRNSWHFKMADRYFSTWNANSNCDYYRMVIFGTFLFMFFTLITESYIVLNLLGFASMIQGTWQPQSEPTFFIVSMYLCTLFTVTGVVVFGTLFVLIKSKQLLQSWYGSITKKADDDKPESFIRGWYRSVKDKTCSPIEFVD